MLEKSQQEMIVRSTLDRYPDLIAIYLFGSSVNETTNNESDIDLALLPKKPLNPLKRWDLSQFLAKLLHGDVDIVDLRGASTVMRMQVISKGICIYEGNKSERDRFEDYVYSSYARLNEERRGIIKDIGNRGTIYG